MTPRIENTIRVRRTALALGTVFLVTLDIGTARAAEAQASLPPSPLRPDAEMGPTKISVAIWASHISKIDSAAQTFTASLFVKMRWHDTRLASIFGNGGRWNIPLKESSDGVVPYWSSHLDAALSEKIVPANHTTAFQNPEAITEMKRILRLYLKTTAQ